MHRREFLTTSAATVAALSAARCREEPPTPPKEAPPEPEPSDGAVLTQLNPSLIPEDFARFPRGVQAGMMTPTGALLWTYVEGPGPLRLRVWRDTTDPLAIKLVKDQAVETTGGFVKQAIDGLGPGHYRFAFFDSDDGRRGPIAHFRTAFAPDDLRPLKIAGLVCTAFVKKPFDAVERTAALNADVLVHLGDMVYADGAVTLEEYRAKWKETMEERSYRTTYASAGLYATWDDHELTDNLNPERIDPAQLAAAKQAYFESVAVEPGPKGELWRSFRWGRTAEIFVLDCRTERKPSTRDTGAAIYISPEQMAWLKKGLAESPCHFKIVLNSVPITDLFGIWDIGILDRWEGYASQRKELVDWIVGQPVQRVFFLAGDFHCAFAARIDADGPARRCIELLVGPTTPDLPNPIAGLADSGDLPREEVFPVKQFFFGSGNRSATTELLFDPLNDRVHVRYVRVGGAKDGEVLYDADLPVELG